MFGFGGYKKIKNIITKKDLNPVIEQVNKNTTNIDNISNEQESINNEITTIKSNLDDKASLSQTNQFHNTNYFNSTSSFIGDTNINNVRITSGTITHNIVDGDDDNTIANKKYVDSKAGQGPDLTNYYNKTEVDNLLNTKAGISSNNQFSGINSFNGAVSVNNSLYANSMSVSSSYTPTNNTDVATKKYVDALVKIGEPSSVNFNPYLHNNNGVKLYDASNLTGKKILSHTIEIRYVSPTSSGIEYSKVGNGERFYRIDDNGNSLGDIQFIFQRVNANDGPQLGALAKSTVNVSFTIYFKVFYLD